MAARGACCDYNESIHVCLPFVVYSCTADAREVQLSKRTCGAPTSAKSARGAQPRPASWFLAFVDPGVRAPVTAATAGTRLAALRSGVPTFSAWLVLDLQAPGAVVSARRASEKRGWKSSGTSVQRPREHGQQQPPASLLRAGARGGCWWDDAACHFHAITSGQHTTRYTLGGSCRWWRTGDQLPRKRRRTRRERGAAKAKAEKETKVSYAHALVYTARAMLITVCSVTVCCPPPPLPSSSYSYSHCTHTLHTMLTGGGKEGNGEGGEGDKGMQARKAPLQRLQHGLLPARKAEAQLQRLRHGPLPARQAEQPMQRLRHGLLPARKAEEPLQ
jgi:hypothetical protein